MADPRMLEKKRRQEAEHTMAVLDAMAARMDAVESKLDDLAEKVSRVLTILETNPHVFAPRDEETGPATPGRRRRRPDPDEES